MKFIYKTFLYMAATLRDEFNEHNEFMIGYSNHPLISCGQKSHQICLSNQHRGCGVNFLNCLYLMIKVGYSTCATKSNRKLVRRVNRQSSCIHVRAQVAVTLHSNKSVERFHELMLRLERRRFNVSECERGRCVAAVADDGPINAPKSQSTTDRRLLTRTFSEDSKS